MPGTVSLNGPWQLVEGGAAEERLTSNWDQPMSAVVPGSVHTALYQAEVIPFPYLGKNQEIAREWSFKTYWYKKDVSASAQGARPHAGVRGRVQSLHRLAERKGVGQTRRHVRPLRVSARRPVAGRKYADRETRAGDRLDADGGVQQQLRLALFEVPAAGNLAFGGDSRRAGRQGAGSFHRHARRQGRPDRFDGHPRRTAKRLCRKTGTA